MTEYSKRIITEHCFSLNALLHFSQANIAGYRAVIEAAEAFPRFLAGQMTAAGKVPPAKVLVLGAGVAGLAAIQTAKNLGAVVRAFDVRPVTKEQVESMGATFLEVPIKEDGSGSGGYAKEMSDEFKAAQAKLMLDQAKDVDIIITTALIPGRKAPILVDEKMLSVMKPGSVCVDLAAANGGNVAQAKPDEIVTTANGVKIIGYTDLPSRLSATASNLVSYFVKMMRRSLRAAFQLLILLTSILMFPRSNSLPTTLPSSP